MEKITPLDFLQFILKRLQFFRVKSGKDYRPIKNLPILSIRKVMLNLY
jgi:hypothetical protein